MARARLLAALIIGALLLCMAGPQLALADPFGQPDNFAPVDGATEIGPTFEFQFDYPPDPAGLELYATQWQWRTPTGNYDSPFYDTGVLVGDSILATYPAGLFAYNQTYYWHVRAQNNRGEWSAWSTETSFTTIANLPPSQPQNTVPGNGATSIPRNPVLAATEFRDPNYDREELVLGSEDQHAASRWQVRTTSGNYDSPAMDSGTVTGGDQLTSYYIDLDHQLAADTQYYFRVCYRDSYGNWSAWSDETSFTTGTDSSNLSQPVNMSPFNGAIDISPDHQLQSSPFYAEGGRSHFASQWQVRTTSGNYTDPVFSSPIDTTNLTAISMPVGTMDLSTTYYWHVRYQDNKGAWSAWSAETSFTLVPNRTPATPANRVPAAGATGVSVTPVLGASPFSDPDTTGYSALADSHAASQWQVRTTSGNYDSPAVDSGTVTGSDQLTSYYIDPAHQLALSTTYYWRVRYQDSFGLWSAWSAETSFTTEATTPDPTRPVNVSPYDGATNISPDHQLQSSPFYAEGGRSHFASQWQVRTTSGNYTDPVFSSPIDTTNLTAISMPVGTMDLSTTYYWHVRYQDNKGAWSAWSAETSFTLVPNRTPATPANRVPAAGATGVSVTPVLGASPFSDPDTTGYSALADSHAASQWQVRTTSGNYDSPAVDSGTVTGSDQLTSYYIDPAHQLALSTTYYWRVRYQDSFGLWSAWSAETSFTTEATTPDPTRPVNVSPYDGATNISPDHQLQSSPFYAEGGRSHFASQWQVRTTSGNYTDPVFSSPIDTTNLTAISMPVGTMDLSTTYYWHVRYQDNKGAWSAWSAETSFTLVPNRTPATPANRVPAAGATGVSVTPVLGASPFSDPDTTGYSALADSHAASQWQVRTTSGNYDSPAVDSGTVTGSDQLTSYYIDPAHQLALSTTYYWRVRYQDSFGLWSAWSAETSFTTEATTPDPTRPVNVSPFNGAIDISPDHQLQSSPFYAEGGRSHFASQWQVRTTSGNYTDPVFSSPIDTTNLTAISMPVGTMDLSTTYYWHVRYQDNKGAWSAWSAETSFTLVPNRTPATPANRVPAAGATGVSVTPVLGASPFSDPDTTGYSALADSHAASQWQVRTTSGNYDSPAVDSGTVTGSDQLTSYYIDPAHQLALSTTYYWRVRYQDSFGLWSAWSAETSFTTEATTPDPTRPVNVSPYDGATNISPDHQLQSSPFYAEGGMHQASYWQVAAEGATQKNPDGGYQQPLFDSRIDHANLQSMALPPGLADYGRTYFWHVKYQDGTGAWSEWSDETSFTIVANLPPGIPVNLQPANGTADLGRTPELTASAFNDCDSTAYAALTDSHEASHWQVRSGDGDYTSPAWDSGQEGAPATSIKVPSGKLLSGAIYYWHVRYQDSCGNWSGWSLETSFTTRSAPTPAAGFSADRTSVVAGQDLVTFTDESTHGSEIVRWAWDFGDGSTDNWTAITRPPDGRIVHRYGSGAVGPQTVTLTVFCAESATGDSETMTVTVSARPAASFDLSSRSPTTGSAVTMTDTSTPADGITSWKWWFDDGTTVTWASPEEREAAGGQVRHTFTKDGTHAVSLTVRSELGDSHFIQQVRIPASGGFRFGLWMIPAAAATVLVLTGAVYLVRRRKAS